MQTLKSHLHPLDPVKIVSVQFELLLSMSQQKANLWFVNLIWVLISNHGLIQIYMLTPSYKVERVVYIL